MGQWSYKEVSPSPDLICNFANKGKLMRLLVSVKSECFAAVRDTRDTRDTPPRVSRDTLTTAHTHHTSHYRLQYIVTAVVNKS